VSGRGKHSGPGARRGGHENPPKADSHQPRCEKGFSHQPLRNWIAAKKPVWRFTVLLFAGLAVFYAGYGLFSASDYMDGFLRLIATISAAVLSALGHQARVNGAVVMGPAFAFEVVRGCDGLEPMGFLLAAALATPATLRTRGLFALVGGVFLLLLNLVRLVSLALVDAYIPRLTQAIHWNVWPGFTVLVVVLVWVCWARRAGLTDWKVGPT
jgi:exosortase/archaeosortase family protein